MVRSREVLMPLVVCNRVLLVGRSEDDSGGGSRKTHGFWRRSMQWAEGV